jgi:hypothetical protein
LKDDADRAVQEGLSPQLAPEPQASSLAANKTANAPSGRNIVAIQNLKAARATLPTARGISLADGKVKEAPPQKKRAKGRFRFARPPSPFRQSVQVGSQVLGKNQSGFSPPRLSWRAVAQGDYLQRPTFSPTPTKSSRLPTTSHIFTGTSNSSRRR